MSEKGYITLLAVLVAGAIAIASVIGISIIGVDSSRQSIELSDSATARHMADACAEEALQQIRSNTAFTGTNTVTIGTATCSYTVTNLGGALRRINTSSTVVTNTRRTTINLVIIGTDISVTSWQETTT